MQNLKLEKINFSISVAMIEVFAWVVDLLVGNVLDIK
jgi:hypothetical protein